MYRQKFSPQFSHACVYCVLKILLNTMRGILFEEKEHLKIAFQGELMLQWIYMQAMSLYNLKKRVGLRLKMPIIYTKEPLNPPQRDIVMTSRNVQFYNTKETVQNLHCLSNPMLLQLRLQSGNSREIRRLLNCHFPLFGHPSLCLLAVD